MSELGVCDLCKSKMSVFDLLTKKQIMDRHDKNICAKCSDLSLDKVIILKRRKKIVAK